jgi:hypothetical protein
MNLKALITIIIIAAAPAMIDSIVTTVFKILVKPLALQLTPVCPTPESTKSFGEFVPPPQAKARLGKPICPNTNVSISTSGITERKSCFIDVSYILPKTNDIIEAAKTIMARPTNAFIIVPLAFLTDWASPPEVIKRMAPTTTRITAAAPAIKAIIKVILCNRPLGPLSGLPLDWPVQTADAAKRIKALSRNQRGCHSE